METKHFLKIPMYETRVHFRGLVKKDDHGLVTKLYSHDGTLLPLDALRPGTKASLKLRLDQFYRIYGAFGWAWEVVAICLVD